MPLLFKIINLSLLFEGKRQALTFLLFYSWSKSYGIHGIHGILFFSYLDVQFVPACRRGDVDLESVAMDGAAQPEDSARVFGLHFLPVRNWQPVRQDIRRGAFHQYITRANACDIVFFPVWLLLGDGRYGIAQ
jgi:hypothetical protein